MGILMLIVVIIFVFGIVYIDYRFMSASAKNRRKKRCNTNTEHDISSSRQILFTEHLQDFLSQHPSVKQLKLDKESKENLLRSITQASYEFIEDTFKKKDKMLSRSNKIANELQTQAIDLRVLVQNYKELLLESRNQLEHLNEKQPRSTTNQMIQKINYGLSKDDDNQ